MAEDKVTSHPVRSFVDVGVFFLSASYSSLNGFFKHRSLVVTVPTARVGSVRSRAGFHVGSHAGSHA